MDVGWILLGCALIILIIMAFRPWRWGGRKDSMEEQSFQLSVGRNMAGRLDEYDARLVRRDEVTRFLSMGQKINAIKVYREDTGASLADAKAAVERMESGYGPVMASGFSDEAALAGAQAATGGMSGDALREEVERLLRQKQKIKAIKVYREQTGLGLREAKDAVDRLEDTLRESDVPEISFPAGDQDMAMDAGLPLTEPPGAEVRNHLLAGNKILAIQAYREQTGASLKAAKEAVERWQLDPHSGWE